MAPAAIQPAGFRRVKDDAVDDELKALKYRAWHRGTREADMMIGGYFDRHHADRKSVV